MSDFEPSPSETHPAVMGPGPAVFEAVTCLGCGCLCDDIQVRVNGRRVIAADRACSIGRDWFGARRPGEGLPGATIDGREVEFAVAVERAAEILTEARAPVVWGLAGSSVEGVAAGLAVADAVGAVVDLAGSEGRAARLGAFQRVGQVSATWGEVKDRADLVVFWGVDPVRTHPRHLERYSVEPRGRFVPGGRADRTVVVVDREPTATAEAADHFVAIDGEQSGEILWVLRALVRGVTVDPRRVEIATGMPYSTMEKLAGLLMGAKYGAFFFGPEPGSAWAAEAVLTLVRDLNGPGRRFVALSLGEGGNPAGAEAVLAWQAGAAGAVDFGSGVPRHRPGDATLTARLGTGEVDAVLVVGDNSGPWLAPADRMRLESIPTIHVAPGATAGPATVAFDVARTGIEAGGTVARSDGVMLPLRPVLASGLPTDRQVLEAIHAAITQKR